MYSYTCTHTHTHTHTHVRAYTHAACACLHTQEHTRTHTRTHKNTHIHTPQRPPGMMEAISGNKDKNFQQGEVKGALKDLGYNESMVYKVRAWDQRGMNACRQ